MKFLFDKEDNDYYNSCSVFSIFEYMLREQNVYMVIQSCIHFPSKLDIVLEKIDDGIVVATSDGAIQLKNVSVPESITINKGDIFG